MAVSPSNPPAPSPKPKIVTAKAKAIIVLKKEESSASTPSPGPTSTDDSLADLSEQLNDREKRKYVKGKKLGEGTYAIVYKGHLRSDPTKLVAIKKIKVNTDPKDGLSLDAIREVKYLQELQHPNIISLLSVFSTKDQNLNLVLEYLPLGDLEMLINDRATVHYGVADIKAWMGMLGRAIWFCHSNYVLHRDIKPNNLLIASDGEIKLADFGLATSFRDPYHRMSYNMITRWYRPPELLYAARYYGAKVDVWSVGVVFAELVLRTPFMPGDTEIAQLDLICHAVGTPTEENWPGVESLDGYLKPDVVRPLRPTSEWMATFPTIGAVGVDLLMKTLMLDPRKRVDATQFLNHEWFRSDPRPTKKENLPRKAGGEERIGEDLKRRGGELEEGRGDKVARKIDFGALKK